MHVRGPVLTSSAITYTHTLPPMCGSDIVVQVEMLRKLVLTSVIPIFVSTTEVQITVSLRCEISYTRPSP